jgi:hypothetical protein
MSLLEQFGKLREAFVKLDEDAGEHCTYSAVIAARDEERRGLDLYPDDDQIWAAHQQVREHCPVETCLHHRDGRCQAGRPEIDIVSERLVTVGVLERRRSSIRAASQPMSTSRPTSFRP